MKTIFIMGGATLLLAACTTVTVPVPVTLGPFLPNLLPQSPPIVTHTTYSPAAVPVLPDPAARTATPAVLTPPVLSPTVNGQTPTAIPGVAAPAPIAIPLPANNTQNLSWVAERIYQNEMGGDERKLISWNNQDNFVALGLGNMVWYPANKRGRYAETFPVYLKFVESQRVPLPGWLANRPSNGGPWQDRAAFERASNDQQMTELRNFLKKTLHLQAAFMAGRLQQYLPIMVQQLPPLERQRVISNLQSVQKSPGGWYPLLDYTNFQGDGANPKDRYQGKGWGLLQVLQAMESVQPGPAALAEFMRAADDTLVQRIANSPSERREARLLTPWQNRVRTYLAGGTTAQR